MPNIIAPELYRKKNSDLVRKYAEQLRGTGGIDPKILADQLGLQVRTVCMIQRKLGERACRDPHAKDI